MLRKLKIKFVVTTMMLIILVLGVCFATFYVNARKNIEKESISALESSVIITPKRPISQEVQNKPFENKFDSKFDDPRDEDMFFNKSGHLSVFCVKLDDFEKMVSVYNYKENLTEENRLLLQKYADSALALEKDTGVLKEFNLRYKVTSDVHSTYISFIDIKEEEKAIGTVIKGFYWIFGLTLTVVLIISFVIANMAVRPVEKAWKRQKQFVADASHELKTPLTVIMASTDVMMSDASEINPQHKKWLECTKAESKRMNELLSGMLYLARSDDETEKNIISSHSVFNLSDVLCEYLLNFEIKCYEQGKTLIQDIDDEIYIKGNESEIKQLVGIFLDNACKYSDDKGKIEVSLKENSGICRMVFKNTGEPIPQSDIPHIFERFYRSDKSRSREAGGYGLGLSIAQTIATKHGVKISVSSEPCGTEFSVKFSKENPKKRT